MRTFVFLALMSTICFGQQEPPTLSTQKMQELEESLQQMLSEIGNAPAPSLEEMVGGLESLVAIKLDDSKAVRRFIIKHQPSTMHVCPLGGSNTPQPDTEMAVYWKYFDAIFMDLIPSVDYPGYGVIKLHWSNNYLRASGTKVVVNPVPTDASFLWSMSPGSHTIRHIDGKYWHPIGDVAYPQSPSKIVLQAGYNANSMWKTIFQNTADANVQGSAITGGQWSRVFGVTNSKAKQVSTQFETSIGFSNSEETTFDASISAEVSTEFMGLGASLSSSLSFGSVSQKTWDSETTITETITIEKGESVFVWQYDFTGSYGRQTPVFSSNIFAHTSTDTPPANIFLEVKK